MSGARASLRPSALAARRSALAPPPRGIGSGLLLKRFGVFMIWAVTLGAVFVGLARLEPLARSYLPSTPPRIEWVDLPVWLQSADWSEVLREVEAQADLQPADRIDDAALCRRVAEAVAASPRVASVVRVEKHADGRIGVQAKFRKPLALVAYRDLALLVDERGVRLPDQLALAQVDRQRWWVIEGVRSPAPRNPGECWGGADVAAGLALVNYLREAEFQGALPGALRTALRGVDVSKVTGRKTTDCLRISTLHPGTYIEWGLAPGEGLGVEASADRKIELLRSYVAGAGGLPSVAFIDLRDERGVGLPK